jgi:hypothetical protein
MNQGPAYSSCETTGLNPRPSGSRYQVDVARAAKPITSRRCSGSGSSAARKTPTRLRIGRRSFSCASTAGPATMIPWPARPNPRSQPGSSPLSGLLTTGVPPDLPDRAAANGQGGADPDTGDDGEEELVVVRG